MAFSPDGQRLATAGYDRTVKVWDAATGQETLTLKGHAEDVLSVTFSPDGRRLAAGIRYGTVKIWDARPAGRRAREPRPYAALSEPRSSPSTGLALLVVRLVREGQLPVTA